MPSLIAPTSRLYSSWMEAREEWAPGAHQDGTGLRLAGEDLDTASGFETWVECLRLQSDRATPVPEGSVHATHLWITEEDRYLGAIDVRHYLNAFLLEAGGNIGYSIRPSARRQGLATWALGAVLPDARQLGLSRVLLTCDEGNVPSARTIEANGGVLEDIRTTSIGVKRRYWIAL